MHQRILFVQHHLAHAASSFLTSPYDEAIVLIEKTNVDVLVIGDYVVRKDDVFSGRESPDPPSVSGARLR